MGPEATVLVTNDDGIGSRFLLELAKAVGERRNVFVCAPDGERSWIGHAITRHERLIPQEVDGFDCPAWKVNGTPADCVNLAIGHLLPKKPDVVVSGINLGYNVTWPMILSSGTVGGALEGALEGLPSIAASMSLPVDCFDEIRENHGEVKGSLLDSLLVSARRTADFVDELANDSCNEKIQVHNLNFPENIKEETPLATVQPAHLKLGSLFSPDAEGGYRLLYRPEWLDDADPAPDTDLAALRQGYASHALLDFSV
tara:strand:- start:7834 stop:8604 length:771 start_codon:yes stop_codon:yes gene_type:complete